jgi:hypothetical protein
MLKKQIAVGWPPAVEDLCPDMRPYATFADELAVTGDFVFKGARVVVPQGA